MAWCRFSSGDAYIYDSIFGGVVCCACRLAGKVKSLFTTGGNLFGVEIEPCKCGGKGCDLCMMHEDTQMWTYEEVLEHIEEHRKAGHQIPRFADEGIRDAIKRGEKPPRRNKRASPVINMRTGKRVPLSKLKGIER